MGERSDTPPSNYITQMFDRDTVNLARGMIHIRNKMSGNPERLVLQPHTHKTEPLPKKKKVVLTNVFS